MEASGKLRAAQPTLDGWDAGNSSRKYSNETRTDNPRNPGKKVHWNKNICTYIPEAIGNIFKSESQKEQEFRKKANGEDDAFIDFPCLEAQGENLTLLVDTGADTSLVKIEALAPHVPIDTTEQRSLSGAFGGNIISKGTIIARHAGVDNFSLRMHVVPEGSQLPADGLLGRDMMWGRAIADTVSKNIRFYEDDREVMSIPLIQKRSRPRVYLAERLSIKGRSQTVISVVVTGAEEEIIVNKSEISPGVFVGETLTSVKEGTAFIPIINTNNTTVTIRRETTLSGEHYKDYQMGQPALINTVSTGKKSNREKLLMETVNLSPDLNPEERDSIVNLLKSYDDIFQLPGDGLSHTNVLTHQIPMDPCQPPINMRQYRLPEVHRNEINKQVNQMLEQELISPSVSPWNSPILLVPKKAGQDGEKKWRLVIDFRKINDATVKQVFPIPRIDEILDQLGCSRYFTTLDLASGYHQVLMNPEDKQKTAFSTNLGHFEFNRMPFGLTGAPATFQRIMNSVLTGLQGIDCFVYLDDIVIYGRNLHDHQLRLERVLTALRRYNLKLQPGKCRFLQREVVYLGHRCSEEGVLPDPSRIKAVKDIPPPRNIKELQAFLGLVNYYRKFIPNCARVSLPLNKLLRKDMKLVWTKDCQEAMDKLKEAITNPPLLQYPDFNRPFILTTDASNGALGAILSQGEPGSDLPIYFASRVLSDTEKRYSTIERELLAVVWATKTFRPYLLGRYFTVFTDHKPLKGIANLRDQEGRLGRLRLKLLEYDFEVRYKPGKLNQNADALSRLPTEGTNICVVTRSRAKDMEKEDEGDGSIMESATNVEPEEGDTATYLTNSEDIRKVLKTFHDSPLGGHQGALKTYFRIRAQYKWQGMQRQIKNYVAACKLCQQNKSSRVNRMPMNLTSTPHQPFERVFMDIVGPLPVSSRGNKYIVTFLDDFSKYLACAAIPDMEAATVAKEFFREIVARFFIPKVLVTDNGSNFTSKLFKEVCKLLGVKNIYTTPYHPQSNGSLERTHRPLAEYLRSFVKMDGTNWDDWLHHAMHVHNNTRHTSTKQTPNRILYGFEFEVPLRLKKQPAPLYNTDDYDKILRYQIQRSFNAVRENQNRAKTKSKEYYDRRTETRLFKVGQMVWLKNQARKNKFSPIWLGPYRVTGVPTAVNVRIRCGNSERVYHNNLVKLAG